MTKKTIFACISGDIDIKISDLKVVMNGITLKIVYFISLNQDVAELMLYDFENMIAMIGRVDYMAQVRSNLGE